MHFLLSSLEALSLIIAAVAEQPVIWVAYNETNSVITPALKRAHLKLEPLNFVKTSHCFLDTDQ